MSKNGQDTGDFFSACFEIDGCTLRVYSNKAYFNAF